MGRPALLHLWEHYHLRGPEILKSLPGDEKRRFFLDFSFPSRGRLVTCPSVSPENTYICPRERGSLCAGPPWTPNYPYPFYLHKAAEILGLTRSVATGLPPRLPQPELAGRALSQVGGDYEEANRATAISLIYALHPGNMISPGTPELARLQKNPGNKGGPRRGIPAGASLDH